jgi:hypothetical protein
MLATNRRILEMEIAAGRAIFVELIYQLPWGFSYKILFTSRKLLYFKSLRARLASLSMCNRHDNLMACHTNKSLQSLSLTTVQLLYHIQIVITSGHLHLYLHNQLHIYNSFWT